MRFFAFIGGKGFNERVSAQLHILPIEHLPLNRLADQVVPVYDNMNGHLSVIEQSDQAVQVLIVEKFEFNLSLLPFAFDVNPGAESSRQILG